MPIWDAALPFVHDMYSCFPWARCIAGEVAHMVVPTVLLDTQRTTLGITSKMSKKHPSSLGTLVWANWTKNKLSYVFSCYSNCYMSCSLRVSECIGNCSASRSQSCSTCLAVKQCRELSASRVSVAARLLSLKYLERNLELIITTPF